ncbi:MAG: IPT/TIG domain-containing protein [Leptospiraceae bacterium]|nr:IPT/TIG domain-containing protein [Leptospiraceae bacterium]
MLRKYYLYLILFLLLITGAFSQEDYESPSTTRNYSIEYFYPKDLSMDLYTLSIRAKRPNDLLKELQGKQNAVYDIKIAGIKCDIKKKTVRIDQDDSSQVAFEVLSYYDLPPGNALITFSRVIDENETVLLASTDKFEVPNRRSSPGKQPLITKVTPEAGKRGDTITIVGQNFGDNVDDIQIIFSETKSNEDLTEEEKNKEKGEPTYLKELLEKRPFYLSTITADNTQEIKFNIPIKKDLLKESFYKKTLTIQVVVGGRPSDYKEIVILDDHWKRWIISLSILLLSILYFMLAFVMKQLNFVDKILIDKDTNTYSLSKFQAIIWTVVLLGSYFYIAISNGLLLGNGTIPDFNPSLIGLLSISYGGLIGANGLGAKKPKNEVVRQPPQLSNLFSAGGSIDISRLQLFGFTIVGVIIYLYNLVNSNPLNGLPDIPTTLLGLMGVSHSGYLGGKVVGDKAAINIVKPYYIPAHLEEGCKVHILGAGFEKKTKLLLDEISEPIETEFVSSSALGATIPMLMTPGPKKITLLPPGKSSVSAENCFEAVLFEEYVFVAKIPITFKMYSHSIPEGLNVMAKGEMDDTYTGTMTFAGDSFDISFPGMLPGNKHLTFYNNDRTIEINLDKALYVDEEENLIFVDEDEDDEYEDDDDIADDSSDDGPDDKGSGGSPVASPEGDNPPISFDTGSSENPEKSFFLTEEKETSLKNISMVEFTINP